MSVENALQYGARVAVELATAKQYDLIILDLMLPAVDGLTICGNCRKNLDCAVILLTTAKVEEKSTACWGSSWLADDYLCKTLIPLR